MFAPWRSQSPLRIAEGSDYWQLIYSFSGSEWVRNVSWESRTKNDNVTAEIVGHEIVVLRSVPRIFFFYSEFLCKLPTRIVGREAGGHLLSKVRLLHLLTVEKHDGDYLYHSSNGVFHLLLERLPF